MSADAATATFLFSLFAGDVELKAEAQIFSTRGIAHSSLRSLSIAGPVRVHAPACATGGSAKRHSFDDASLTRVRMTFSNSALVRRRTQRARQLKMVVNSSHACLLFLAASEQNLPAAGIQIKFAHVVSEVCGLVWAACFGLLLPPRRITVRQITPQYLITQLDPELSRYLVRRLIRQQITQRLRAE